MTQAEYNALSALAEIEEATKEVFVEMLVRHRNTLVKAGLTPDLESLYLFPLEPIRSIDAAKATIRIRSRKAEVGKRKGGPLRIGSLLRREIG
jgi:hypothetical protein